MARVQGRRKRLCFGWSARCAGREEEVGFAVVTKY
uniref:Uncharacterized protein n=1 Tax=Arundo donax TaxID=35708 RepID=A0A0A9AJP5_ARUDO